ncbi:MAG: serine/threonine protein kinase [Eggerthellaceae bacterium]
MSIDDAYTVERVLAQGKSGMTEIVTIDGTGPFIRKRIFHASAHRSVWAALSECSCPRLPHVEATYETPDTFVVICSYVPGCTLAEHMAEGKGQAPKQALAIIEGICEAVAELHRHSIIHCDITPENIIIAADGAHLIDLGIARMEYEGSSSQSAHLGTWGFAAPEQYGFANVDRRSDIYSLGRLSGYLLTGIRPDSDRFEPALADLARQQPGLLRVIKRACTFEPSGRYQSVASFLEDFRAAVSGGVNLPASNAADRGEGAGAPFGDAECGNAHATPAAPFGAQGSSAPPSAASNAYWDTPSQQGLGADAEASGARPAEKKPRRKAIVLVVLAVCVVLAALAGGGYALFSIASSHSDESRSVRETPSASEIQADSSLGSEASSSSIGDDARSSAVTADEVPFSIVESGYSVSSSGYVHYAVTIRNDSEDRALLCPEIIITGRGKDGSVVFSDTQTYNVISPGTEMTFTGQAGNGNAPAEVGFSTGSSMGSTWTSSLSSGECYTVENASYVEGSLGGSFVGEVTTNPGTTEALGGQPLHDNVRIDLVLKDGSGKLAGGFETYITPAKEGESTTFEVRMYDDIPFDSYEIYASAW